MHALRRLWVEDDGVTAVEYALIAGLVFLAIVVAVGALSAKTRTTYDTIQAQTP